MKARYIRVSTEKQKIDRQREQGDKSEKWFIDVVSGAVDFKKREQGKKLIEEIEQGTINYLSVSSIDRLGRNLFDILRTLEYLNEKKVILKVDNLGIESLVKGKPNSAFKLIISVMANIAEMERSIMLERQRQGIELAKQKGVYKGREKGSKESDEVFLSKYKGVQKELKLGVNSLRKIAKLNGVSLGTVQKVKKLMKG
ncbi:MAG: recombinase family protein [Flavobacteriaceae bacterium]|nr:recombinase family protein [Flavobacteriaceae bacterium]